MGAGQPDRGSARRAPALLRDASQYVGATYVGQIGSFAVGLVTKGLLGPANVGIWSLFNILLGYLAAAQVGAGDAIAKEVPYLREKGDLGRARRLIRAMLGFVLSGSALVGAVVVVLALAVHGLEPAYRVGLLVIGASFPVWMLQNMEIVVLRSAKRFDVLSRQLVLQLAITALVAIPLIWRFSIYGQYAAFVVALAGVLAYLHRAVHRHRAVHPEAGAQVRPSLDWEATRHLLGIGLPLQISNLVFMVQTTADSLLAARLLGITALGYYSIAVTVKGYVYQTPDAFSVVMFPRFQEKFAAARDDPAALRQYVETPIRGFAFLVLPTLIGASWQVVPFLVHHFLPAFNPAVPAIKILLVGTFFASLWHMPLRFLIAVNKLWHGVIIATLNAILVIIGVLVATTWHTSVEAVAVGTSVAYAVALLGTTAYVESHFRSVRGVMRFLMEIVAAAAVLFTALAAADRWIPEASSLGPDIVRVLLRSAAVLVPGALVFWWADRSLNLRQYFAFRPAGNK